MQPHVNCINTFHVKVLRPLPPTPTRRHISMQTAAWLDLINNSDYNGSNDNREGDMRQSW